MDAVEAARVTLPVLLLLAGLAIGAVTDVVMARLGRRWSRRPGRDHVRAYTGAARWLPTLLGALAGLRLAAIAAEIDAEAMPLLEKAVAVLAVLGVTIVAARLAGEAVRHWMSRVDTQLPSSSIFVNVTRAFVLVVGGLVAVATMGISIAPMLTALGVVGLAVSLAMQDTLGNLFAGIQILLSRQVQPGDMIQLESGERGWVHDVTWRNTTVRLLSNDLAVVPNAKLATSIVTNFTTLDAEHVVWVEAAVAYGSDLDRVEAVTLEVAREALREVPGGVIEFEPQVRFHGFGESAIALRVSLRGHEYQDRWPLMHELVKRLHRRYAAEGIEIPFPQRDVHVKPAGGA